MTRKRVAIVGSGCSGLGALWALKSTDHEVHLFEAKGRLGGHTNTVPFSHNGQETMVDTHVYCCHTYGEGGGMVSPVYFINHPKKS